MNYCVGDDDKRRDVQDPTVTVEGSIINRLESLFQQPLSQMAHDHGRLIDCGSTAIIVRKSPYYY